MKRNELPQLGTRQFCRDNVTMSSDHKVVLLHVARTITRFSQHKLRNIPKFFPCVVLVGCRKVEMSNQEYP